VCDYGGQTHERCKAVKIASGLQRFTLIRQRTGTFDGHASVAALRGGGEERAILTWRFANPANIS
jgi:hypothetical protein